MTNEKKTNNKKPNSKKAKKPILGGAGGSYDLPFIYDVLNSKTGCGTYRGEQNSISTVGLDLPVPKFDNPPGTGPKYDLTEKHEGANGSSKETMRNNLSQVWYQTF
ncbi:hypothetical protein PG997_007232 [Apiospora hydei]|uniref:Uncharacterized protein n=1 Tax=Apiospora hydei TaxID=1337664 RepID=A0ABR1WB48_9PEZI